MLRLGAMGLLILVLSGTALNHVYFSVRKGQIHTDIKQQIKQSIPESDLHIVRFASNDSPKWLKDQKEFKYNGHLYDVVKVKKDKNGNAIYYCIDDVKEELLFAHLDNVVNNLLGDPDNSFGSSLNSIAHAYTAIQLIHPVFAYTETFETNSIFQYKFSVNTNNADTEVPPPNHC